MGEMLLRKNEQDTALRFLKVSYVRWLLLGFLVCQDIF